MHRTKDSLIRQLTEAHDQNIILEYYQSSINPKLNYVTFNTDTDPSVITKLKAHLEAEYGATCMLAECCNNSFVLTIRL